MVNKPVIRPYFSGGGGVALGGVARIPMVVEDAEKEALLWTCSTGCLDITSDVQSL